MPEASRVSTPVTQVNHGFTRGDAVRFDGTNWVLAATGSSGVGMAGSLYSSDSFEFVQLGELDALSGLVPGALYYPAPGGGVLTTANGAPVGLAYTVSTLFVLTPAATMAVTSIIAPFASVSASQLTAVQLLLQAQIDVINVEIGVLELLVLNSSSKTLVYTGQLLTSIADAYGTKTFTYDINNRLTGVTGTGKYRSKTFAYTGDQLTSITVT